MLNENYNLWRVRSILIIQSRNMAAYIGPQTRMRILLDDLDKLAIALSVIALAKAELLHPREFPNARSAIFEDNNCFDIAVHRFGHRGKSIPTLKKPGPEHIRADECSDVAQERGVERYTPASDRENVKSQKRADTDALCRLHVPELA